MFQYVPIGRIHSPFTDVEGMPIQPTGENAAQGEVEIFSDYVDGLQDIEGFSHLILLYHFHRVPGPKMTVVPYMDDRPHGVFATRSPARPNPIGLSVVRLLGREGNRLQVEGIDILDGTPLLDLKPSIPSADHAPVERCGWLDEVASTFQQKKADKRFHR